MAASILGWYPETDIQGTFHVKVIVDELWENLSIEYVSREKKEFVKTGGYRKSHDGIDTAKHIFK